ncbi:NADH-quinone oxidoreductase subunit C [Paenibacillus ferrarius]|uniref:NADH-quinone oxidoreductase subunit C n=1 Tax=Paenibacillus ferrarius TaxID=1469647 RepID=UPI003D2A4870
MSEEKKPEETVKPTEETAASEASAPAEAASTTEPAKQEAGAAPAGQAAQDGQAPVEAEVPGEKADGPAASAHETPAPATPPASEGLAADAGKPSADDAAAQRAAARAARLAARAAADQAAEPASAATPAPASADAGDDEKAAKAAAAAEARAARAAARGAKTDAAEPAAPKEPSPNQPLLDRLVAIIKDEAGEDAIVDAFINERDGHRPYIVVHSTRWVQAATTLRDHEELRCNYLRNLSGVDQETHLEVAYHLLSLSHRHEFCVKVKTDRENPSIPSVTDIWPTANWNEREVYDLLGIDFPGHPNLVRIMMPDDWVGHPLRKDYEPLDPEV